MSADYAPGTIAVATVRGVKGQRVFRRKDHHGTERWETGHNLNGWLGHDDSDVTDIRPLVVLDLDAVCSRGHEAGQGIAWCVRNHKPDYCELVTRVADQIEAQTKPPRIPEPGLWGVVEGRFEGSDERFKFIRTEGPWIVDEDGSHAFWNDIIDPVLIREGVAS